MEHIFTLDLSTMPLLAARYPDARTMSLFCHSPHYNEAWEPNSGWTAVLFSAQAQIDANPETPEAIDPAATASFEVVEVCVDMDDDAMRDDVYKAGARVLGAPIWLQNEEYWGDFVMQFDESFAWMNLGDSGVMYVFEDTAFWQCY